MSLSRPELIHAILESPDLLEFKGILGVLTRRKRQIAPQIKRTKSAATKVTSYHFHKPAWRPKVSVSKTTPITVKPKQLKRGLTNQEIYNQLYAVTAGIDRLDTLIEYLVEEEKWMQTAVKRPGAFKAKADRVGMTTAAFAQHVRKNPHKFDTRTKRQANLASVFHKFRPKGKPQRA